jgi:ribose transport system substrate-binding protein
MTVGRCDSRPERQRRRSRPRTTVLVVGAVVLVVAAVVGGTGQSASAAAGTTSPIVAQAKAALAKVSTAKGDFSAPPSDSPKAPRGKSIFVIPISQSIPGFAAATADITGVGQKLGWKVRIWDGKFEPNVWLTGLRAAVTAKADGIITIGLDCPAIRAGLIAAKTAGIPVINAEGHDCDAIKPGAKPLFTHTVHYKQGTLDDWTKAVARDQAYWLIAKTNGTGKVIEFVETDSYTLLAMASEFERTMKMCSTCAIVEKVTLTGADFGPKLQQKAEQAMLKHPDAKAIWPSGTESLLPAGVAAAIRSSQAKPVAVGWECDQGMQTNLKTGVLGACLNYVPGWEGYAAVDALVRIFAGKRPTTKTGIGIRLVDQQHNLKGFDSYQAPIDFASVYEKAWGITK